MSPALFTLVFDVLCWILSWAEADGLIHGIEVSRENPTFSHFMFADDLTIYFHAKEEETQAIMLCLSIFCEWFSQKVNVEKSSVHFRHNASEEVKGVVYTILNMLECTHNTR